MHFCSPPNIVLALTFGVETRSRWALAQAECHASIDVPMTPSQYTIGMFRKMDKSEKLAASSSQVVATVS